MRILCLVVALSASASLERAQAATGDVALLTQTRAAYDVPFERGLKSFDCAIDFNWKQHWKDTYRVGDEGADEEIETHIQPLHNRVVVTHEDAVVSSGMRDEEERKLPRGGMAEGLLKHAVRFSLRTWLVAANNALLPSADTPVHFESSASGYLVGYKIRNFDVVMQLTRDSRLQSMSAKGSEGDRQEFDFQSGPQGLVLGLGRWARTGTSKPEITSSSRIPTKVLTGSSFLRKWLSTGKVITRSGSTRWRLQGHEEVMSGSCTDEKKQGEPQWLALIV